MRRRELFRLLGLAAAGVALPAATDRPALPAPTAVSDVPKRMSDGDFAKDTPSIPITFTEAIVSQGSVPSHVRLQYEGQVLDLPIYSVAPAPDSMLLRAAMFDLPLGRLMWTLICSP